MSDTTTVTSTDDLMHAYFEMWNETDPARRAQLVRGAFAPEGRHVDPLADVTGHDAVDAMVAGVQEQFPGHLLRRTSVVDAHHDQLRYAWELTRPDGTTVVTAVEVARIDGSGRMASVVAFFGELTPA